jgi:hypothetical protein
LLHWCLRLLGVLAVDASGVRGVEGVEGRAVLVLVWGVEAVEGGLEALGVLWGVCGVLEGLLFGVEGFAGGCIAAVLST